MDKFPALIRSKFIYELTFLIFLSHHSTAASDKIDEWIVRVFKHCTLQILGDPREFNVTIPYFASRQPIVIDVYNFPSNQSQINWKELVANTKNTSLFKRKYTYCSTQLYYPNYHPPRPNYILLSTVNAFYGMVLSNQDPHFVILMFTRFQETVLSVDRYLTSLWNTISLTGVLLLALKNNVRLICPACSNSSENPLGNLLNFSHVIGSHENLSRSAEVISRNLNQQIVLTNNFSSILYGNSISQNKLMQKKCHQYPGYLICCIFTLLQKYNFTLYDPYRQYQSNQTQRSVVGRLFSGTIMSRTGTYQTFLEVVSREGSRNAWIPYGCNYLPYKYVAFLSKIHATKTNFMSIFQPFDITTGFLLMASIFGLVWVTIGFLKIPELADVQRLPLKTVVLFPITSFIEQSDGHHVIARFRHSFGGYFLISTWLFLCYTIGNEFKGIMYSSMTSSIIPPVPQSMIDLVMFSDMPYFTTTKHFYNGSFYSTLKDMVIVDLDTGEDNFMKKFFSRFRNDVSLLYGTETAVINNITKELPVYTDQGMKFIRKEFALVSTEDDIDHFVRLMEKLTEFYVIIPNKYVSPFISRIPWFGRRNHFNKLATMGIAHLVESGMHDRWVKLEKQYRLIGNLKDADNKLNVRRGNYFAMILLSDSQLAKQTQKASAISLNNVDLVFIWCSVLIFTSLVVFVTEFFVDNLSRIILGDPTEFNVTIPYFASRQPIVIDVYNFPTCSNPLENPLGDLLDSSYVIRSHEALSNAVEILSQNLNQKVLWARIYDYSKLSKNSTCSLNKAGLQTPYGVCSIITLGQKYNFSLYNPDNPDPLARLFGDLGTGQAMSRTGIHQNFLDAVTTMVRQAWIPYGCVYKPYKYVAFLSKKHAVSFISLFQPFDATTGYFLMAAFVGLILTTVGSKKFLKLLKIQNLRIVAIVWFPINSFIEQSDDHVVDRLRHTIGGYFLVSTWLFLCYTIGNEYKGFLYSSLTSSPIPSVPQSMTDLVMLSDMPYFMTTKHHYNGTIYSTLKDMVIADVKTGEDNFLNQFFYRFRNHISLLYGTETAVINNITKEVPVYTDRGMKLITKEFAVIGFMCLC
ncbi:unnamed protein product [Orchesella dallaii]|uniref:Uncharacterized protein n=1 Tax=Orchesella dallaii TaxID=48710 RepID=A0ABP1Q3K9_9HEXA